MKTLNLQKRKNNPHHPLVTPFGMVLCLLLFSSSYAWAWGELGHRIVAEYGTNLSASNALENCHITGEEIVSHTNDPDKIWKRKRRDYPNEAQAHFFHVERQPQNWRSLKEPKNLKDGFLVYRITSWIEEAKFLRKKKDWDGLKTKLYGLSHYVGDLTQPLHLYHDFDGEEAGLPDIHSQFESRMINRYEEEIRNEVRKRLASEKIPPLWTTQKTENLIYTIAEQTGAKAATLLELARPALKEMPSRKKRGSLTRRKPRFVKSVLYNQTGSLAAEQLTLGARLWGYVLNQICSF